jgi:ubiquitin
MDLKKLKEESTKAQETKHKSVKDLKKVEDKKQPMEEKKLEFAERVKTYNIEYQGDSKLYKANVKSKVMDSDARISFERVLSNLSAGINFTNMPMEIKNRHYSLARIVCQLVDPPEWLLQAASEDMSFCYQLGGLLVDHENHFFYNSDSEDQTLQNSTRFRISE